ncbi:MAG: WG repeat-containing protein [Bacillales bacterium]|nr:WG repeat-containing protein [Bacillales bacterium]
MKKNLSFFVILFSVIIFASCNNEDCINEGKNLYRILVGDKYGYMDSQGNIVIEPQYDGATLRFKQVYCMVSKDDKKFLIDKNNNVVKELDNSIEIIEPFSVGEDINFIVKKTGDKWYICDSLLKKKSDYYDEFIIGDELFNVKKNNKWGFIDCDGNIVIDFIYDKAWGFGQDSLARVVRDNKHFYIDTKGNCVISVDSTITDFHNNRAAVIKDGEKCLIDKHGIVICKLDVDEIYIFGDDNLATVVKDDRASKIDTLGNIVLETDFRYIHSFYNGFAYAFNIPDFNLGLIDSLGNVIVPFIFDSARDSEEDNIYIFIKQAQRTKSSYIKEATYYYNSKGQLIWKDVPMKQVFPPKGNSTRKDFVEYFDGNISKLDPIEGIYYVTIKDYYQERGNYNNIGLNKSQSYFWAVIRENINGNDFYAYFLDGSGMQWVNKFVKLGETNNYAIIKTQEDIKYSSEGKVTIDNPSNFDFRLETGKNSGYNFFVTYEWERDYPPVENIEQYQKAEWTGSGFAISNGYIATNYHVTNGAKTIRIKGINGDTDKVYKGVVVASDEEHDLSVIKIVDKNFETLGKIPYSIGKSNVEVGDNIFVLGYPLVTSMGNEIKLTEGVISSSTGYKGNQSMLQISAAVQPGNSGGPLFNEEGDVVGVVCAKHENAENANYAVKISYLYSMIEASGYNIEINDINKVHKKKLSAKVKEIKDYVYLIECSSK